MNAINVISPYKYLDMWVFDDSRVGLLQEPFVSGIDIMIERMVADIPRADFELVHERCGAAGGAWRRCSSLVWLATRRSSRLALRRQPSASPAHQFEIRSRAEQGFVMLFAATPFPGYQLALKWRRADGGGNWYHAPQLDMEGWLCPALFKYFADAPKELFVQIKAKSSG